MVVAAERTAEARAPEGLADRLRESLGDRRLRDLRPFAAATAALALVLATNVPARAHARLVRAEPANGGTGGAPPAIELWFNELLDDELNDVAVYRAGPDGAPADEADRAAGPPRVDPADRTHLTAPVGALAPGSYVVQYKVLSRDGHGARGRIVFRVGAPD